MNRLSPVELVADDVHRLEVYRRLLAYLQDQTASAVSHEVKHDEATRTDLAAYRAYGFGDLGWVFLLVCEMDDHLAGLPVGYSLRLPPLSVIQRVMREVMDAQ